MIDRPIKRYAHATAGTLDLRVRFVERTLRDHGIRPRYAVTVIDTTDGRTYRDAHGVYGPAGQGPINPPDALGALVSFLSATAEAYASRMEPYDPDTTDAPDFPAWLQEAAYMNGSELAMLSCDLEEATPEYA